MSTEKVVRDISELSEEERKELDRRAREGETVVEGGTGGGSLAAQFNLAKGRRKGGMSTTDKSGHERAEEEGITVKVAAKDK